MAAEPQIAQIPNWKVITPPKNAPDTNERTMLKKRMERRADSRSLWVMATYAALDADRRFPVDIVVQKGESTSFLKEDI